MTPRRRLAACDDAGSVLVVSLVIVTVVAVVVGALLSYADSNVRATVALRAQAAQAATAEGAAQAALDELRTSTYNNDLSSSTFDKCFGPDAPTATAEGDDVLRLDDFIPGSRGAAANSAAVRCTPDPSTGASGQTVPITSANKPGNAILTLGTSTAEHGIEVKALNTSLPFNVHGGIVSNSTIAVTDGTLRSSVDVRAAGACTGDIEATPDEKCDLVTTVPDPGYTAETSTVPAYRPVPANVAANCPGKVLTFLPGHYDDATALSGLMDGNGACKGSVWWFTPGTYYFDFTNSGSHQWLVKDGQLLAGTPVDADGEVIGQPVTPVSMPGACANPIESTTAVGVQFIFGGDSRMQMAGTAGAEICGSYNTDRPPLAVYGMKTGTGGTTTTPGAFAQTVDGVTGFVPSPSPVSAADAVKAAADSRTLTWGPTSTATSATVNLSAFSPATAIPAGSILTSARVRFVYGTSTAVDARSVVVTPTHVTTPTAGTAVTKSLSKNAMTATSTTQTVDLTTDLATVVKNRGLSGLNLAYASARTGTATEVLDAVLLDVTYTAPALRAQSGCITQVYSGGSGCAVISTTESYSGTFYIQGTTYVPLAPVDISLSNITAQVLRFGVVSRVLRVKETGALSYDGPVIEIPDDSPGYGPGGTVVLLQAYVCAASASCEPPGGPDDPAVPDGELGLRVRAYIKDAGALGPTDGRSLVVQSWAVQR